MLKNRRFVINNNFGHKKCFEESIAKNYQEQNCVSLNCVNLISKSTVKNKSFH